MNKTPDLPACPSFAARKFASRISTLADEARAVMRDRFEAQCARSPNYVNDGYDHPAEKRAYDAVDHELKMMGA